MNSELIVEDITIEVKHKHIRSLRMTVRSPHGHVSISAPFLMDAETVRRFAASKIDWIRKHQTIIRSQPWTPPPQFITGEQHFFLGKPYRLEVIERTGKAEVVIIDKNNNEKNSQDSSPRHSTLGLGMIVIQDSKYSILETGCLITMYVRPRTGKKKRAALLDAWYREQLKEIVPKYIAHYEPMMNVSVSGWGIKKMKTKWGTCNIAKRRIWLNLELAKKPIEFVEEVIVHEMVHLLERKHNKRFKLLLEKYLAMNN
ncbi:MAG: SprT family zinc-dependent metalloprotease [Bacteroidota bacterium]